MNGLQILLLSSSFLLSLPSYSEDIFDVAENYNKEKIKVSELETQHRQALAEVYRIEKETEKIVIKKAELDEKKVRLDHEMNQVSLEIIELEQKLKELTPELTQRIELTEKINEMPWLYALVSSQSITELEEMIDVAESLNREQSEQIFKFVSTHKSILAKKTSLKKAAQNLVQLEKEMKKKEKHIAQKENQKKSQLSKVKNYLNIRKNKMARLKDKGHALSKRSEFKDLEILFDQGFSEKKGQLPQPTQGTLIQGYGLNRKLSYDHIQALHNGHFYQTQPSEDVHSVAPGQVKHISRQPGYGYVAIVEHGGRYYSTYANLKSVSVNQNDTLEAEQIIGKTGAKHLQMGIGLYFEIRHFSQPQDPAKWLQPKNSSLATLMETL